MFCGALAEFTEPDDVPNVRTLKRDDPVRIRRTAFLEVVLHAGPLAIGPLISFETTFSDLPRREVQLGAQLLVYQSSTSTYEGSWAQPQLASEVAVHAAEVGRPAVHAGLSGDSAAFDARGRKLAWCPSAYRGATVVSVPLGSDNTMYQCVGDWMLALAFSILAGAGVLATLRSSTQIESGGAVTKARQTEPKSSHEKR